MGGRRQPGRFSMQRVQPAGDQGGDLLGEVRRDEGGDWVQGVKS